MNIFTRIKTPSKWKRNYLVNAMKKQGYSGFSTGRDDMKKAITDLSEDDKDALRAVLQEPESVGVYVGLPSEDAGIGASLAYGYKTAENISNQA